MCGILAALGLAGDPEQNRRRVLRCSKLQRHRGPDANSIYQSKDGKTFLAFERLQIIDPSDGGRYAVSYTPGISAMQTSDAAAFVRWVVVT